MKHWKHWKHWARFLAAVDQLAPTPDDEAPIAEIERTCGWPHGLAVAVAWELIDVGAIQTDAGLGQDPIYVEGRRRW